MTSEEFLEAGVDFERANVARMYDYFLGGAHNFAVDREHAGKLLAANPEMATLARSNRAYLGRVVRWCADRGIDQYLDLGSGVPTVGNVHEVAHQELPGARVAYVDFEPVAVAHSREITADLDSVTVTRADLREPESVLSAPGVAELLDLTRPVALLAISCLHFVLDDPASILARYHSRMVPGSVVAVSHASDDVEDATVRRQMQGMAEAFAGSASQPVLRDRAKIAALLGDLDLAEAGVVDIGTWPRSDAGTRPTGGYAAVAIKL